MANLICLTKWPSGIYYGVGNNQKKVSAVKKCCLIFLSHEMRFIAHALGNLERCFVDGHVSRKGGRRWKRSQCYMNPWTFWKNKIKNFTIWCLYCFFSLLYAASYMWYEKTENLVPHIPIKVNNIWPFMRKIVKWIGSFNIFRVCSDDIPRRWKPNLKNLNGQDSKRPRQI